jgi:uncharacterized protein (DUF427 family)
MARPRPDKALSGQESVWDYPRPPRLEPVSKTIQIRFNKVLIADTRQAYRVLETSHPPVYYIPQDDIQMACLIPVSGGSWCEWKGAAMYYDVVVGEQTAGRAAWSYPRPTPSFAPIAAHLAFYAWAMDECLIDGERVTPQPGRFYGGWITSDIVGPFKGVMGSGGW